MSELTFKQYDQVVASCRDVFAKKTKDYGTSWRIMRIPTVTDQLYIKAKRIRTIDEKGTQKVEDNIQSEFMACVNYGIIGLIQLSLKSDDVELETEKALALYDENAADVRRLMVDKNHDYGEAWRDMRIPSLTDMILTKLHRIKQIEANDGKTLISEGIAANYMDIINYAIFALLKLNEKKD